MHLCELHRRSRDRGMMDWANAVPARKWEAVRTGSAVLTDLVLIFFPLSESV